MLGWTVGELKCLLQSFYFLNRFSQRDRIVTPVTNTSSSATNLNKPPSQFAMILVRPKSPDLCKETKWRLSVSARFCDYNWELGKDITKISRVKKCVRAGGEPERSLDELFFNTGVTVRSCCEKRYVVRVFNPSRRTDTKPKQLRITFLALIGLACSPCSIRHVQLWTSTFFG